MDPQILAAIIGAVGAVIAGILTYWFHQRGKEAATLTELLTRLNVVITQISQSQLDLIDGRRYSNEDLCWIYPKERFQKALNEFNTLKAAAEIALPEGASVALNDYYQALASWYKHLESTSPQDFNVQTHKESNSFRETLARCEQCKKALKKRFLARVWSGVVAILSRRKGSE